jgi:hypothetical protein
LLTTARVLRPVQYETIMPVAAPTTKKPPHTCADHNLYVAGCEGCRQAQTTYKTWQRRQRAYGRFVPFVDAEPARRRLRDVIDYYGFSSQQLAPYVGVSGWSVANIATGVVKQVRPETAAAVLAIEPLRIMREDPDLPGSVTSLGSARRLQALMAIGYDCPDLAEEVGSAAISINHWRLRRRPTIAVRFYRRIREVYTDLHTRPGPSPEAAVLARELRYPPPICWDDDDHLDNPPGRPRQYESWCRLNPDPRTLAGAV